MGEECRLLTLRKRESVSAHERHDRRRAKLFVFHFDSGPPNLSHVVSEDAEVRKGKQGLSYPFRLS